MKTFIISIKAIIFFTILTGIIYPLFIFGIGKIFFSSQINGSLITKNSKVIGSELIGQKFDSTIYFHSRPSFVNYEPTPSSGSNLGPTSSVLKHIVDSLRKSYVDYNGLAANADVPPDAIFSSASGIDPHISYENASLQIDRIMKARGFNSDKKNKLTELVKNMIENPKYGFLGEPVINVVKLNIELDKL